MTALLLVLGGMNLVFGMSFLFSYRPDYPFAFVNFMSAACCFIVALT